MYQRATYSRNGDILATISPDPKGVNATSYFSDYPNIDDWWLNSMSSAQRMMFADLRHLPLLCSTWCRRARASLTPTDESLMVTSQWCNLSD